MHLTKNRMQKLSNRLADLFASETSSTPPQEVNDEQGTMTLRELYDALKRHTDASVYVRNATGDFNIVSLNFYGTHLREGFTDALVIPSQMVEMVNVQAMLSFFDTNVIDREVKRGNKYVHAESSDNVVIQHDGEYYNISAVKYRKGKYGIILGGRT